MGAQAHTCLQGLLTMITKNKALGNIPKLAPIADRLGCTVAQLALAWCGMLCCLARVADGPYASVQLQHRRAERLASALLRCKQATLTLGSAGASPTSTSPRCCWGPARCSRCAPFTAPALSMVAGCTARMHCRLPGRALTQGMQQQHAAQRPAPRLRPVPADAAGGQRQGPGRCAQADARRYGRAGHRNGDQALMGDARTAAASGVRHRSRAVCRAIPSARAQCRPVSLPLFQAALHAQPQIARVWG